MPVKSLDVFEHIGSRLVSGPIGFALSPFGLKRQKLSIAASSQMLPNGSAADDAVVGH